MLLSLLLIFAISFGGLGITYLLSDDEPLLWRLAAGCVIGTAIFGSAGFAAAMLLGLSPFSAMMALASAISPLLLFYDAGRRKRFAHDWSSASGKLQGANLTKFLRFVYYAFFLFLFLLFFGRAMIETDQGIFTGGSNNLGDLPFHLGAVFSFTDGANFPPVNPNFSGSKFTYPFIADLTSAMFLKLGVGAVRDVMLVQNTAWAFSLLIVFEGFVRRITESRLAARMAAFFLFFSGGLGFIAFLGDYWAQGAGFFEFLGHLPKDYTINDQFRWGNSLVTLFLTQRSLLLGMPITVIVLAGIWKIYISQKSDAVSAGGVFSRYSCAVYLGLLAGLLPLIHLHSLAVLFTAGFFLLIFNLREWRAMLLFAAGTAAIAVPEIIWLTAGSATHIGNFFAWHPGWDSRGGNIIWFWLKNTGLLFPLLFAGIYFVFESGKNRSRHEDGSAAPLKSAKKHSAAKGHTEKHPPTPSHPLFLLTFYIPFAFIFLAANLVKLAPWEWDNIKVLIYWYAVSIPFISFATMWFWERGGWLKIAAGGFFAVMIFSGGLDIFRTVSGQINYKIFNADAVVLANRLKASTAPSSIFLNAPTYNSAVVLSGRISVMRYPGHLSSHGIDYSAREADVKSIYRGVAEAEELLKKYGVNYVLISPEERNQLAVNDNFFRKFSVIAESGPYRVYAVGGK